MAEKGPSERRLVNAVAMLCTEPGSIRQPTPLAPHLEGACWVSESVLGCEVYLRRSHQRAFKQKGHSAHLLPEELIRDGSFWEPRLPAASPSSRSFFLPPFAVMICSSSEGAQWGRAAAAARILINNICELAFMRLQLGKGSDEALGGKIKAKTCTQGNGLDAVLATQVVTVVPHRGGCEAPVLSIPPRCRAAGCNVAGERRSRIFREGARKPQGLRPKQAPAE